MHDELRDRVVAARRQHIPRPCFVEFAGTPKSGKSTCIETVGHFFRRNDYKVLAPTEGASKRTPYYLKEDLVSFNVWSACYALTHILEGVHGSDQFQIAFLDRGLFDALAWFEFLGAEGDIDAAQREAIQQFLLMDKWRSVIDAVFLFRADPETSLKREYEGKLIRDPGRAMNPEFLEKLNQAYAVAQEKFAHHFSNFFAIDTGKEANSTPQSTAAEVVDKIIGVLENAEGKQ